MRDGGVTEEGTGTGEGQRPGPAATLRRRRLLASAVALVLAVGGTAVPLVLAAGDDEPGCREIPASTRALTKDPAAATRALDPGDDMSRYPAVRGLVRQENPCGDGAEVLGRLVEVATVARGPGAPHTLAQARCAYAVVAALDGADVPHGMAPGVARVLADYVADEARFQRFGRDSDRPVVPPEPAAPDDTRRTGHGRFLAPGEAHVDFDHEDEATGARPEPVYLVHELARNPEAFAILYAAERAYFAHYLERLTRQGGDPDHRPDKREKWGRTTATDWPDNDLEDIAERVGALMQHRVLHAKEGGIPDLAAFDATVRRHTRGAYEAAPRQLTTRPPMGDIADRPVAGPVRGDLMDGRHHLLTVLDAWAGDRGVPEERARVMRQIVDDAYVRSMWREAALPWRGSRVLSP